MKILISVAIAAMLCLELRTSAMVPVEKLPPIRALLITGHNNHNWQYTSRLHKDTLEATGRFVVDITDAPQTTLTDAAALEKYDVFVLDYNDFGNPKRWGEPAETNFLNAVRNGTGVVAIHSANNAFDGWDEYEKMLAIMWREGTGHGRFHSFDVKFTDPEHPVTRGLADFTRHPDELYHRLVNEHGVKFDVLATAYSSPDTGGTGSEEPMAIALTYGKGRVFATPLGHVWVNARDTKVSVADPQFKILLCRAVEWAATGDVTLTGDWEDTRQHNRLTQDERENGWQLLFNGGSLASFRGFKQKSLPESGWIVEDGSIRHVAGQGGGDIVAIDQFDNFEFTCEWKISPGGNSGIFYRSTEDHDYAWQTGPEMQVLDDVAHHDGKNETTRAGTLYGLINCAHDTARPPGEWNHVRIIARGTKIEHWLNGFKVIEYDLDSDSFKKLKADSKFADMHEFATRSRGHIVLQDHGDDVWFRNLKIRPIPSP